MTQKTSHPTLLMIAQVIALSDGSISEEEEKLILELPERLGLTAMPRQNPNSLPTLTSLGEQLNSHGDRCLAARIAGLVAGVSRNPNDQQDINPEERTAYRELISALQLESNELDEIEWSVRQELAQGQSLMQMIGKALFGKDAWPDQELIAKTPEIPGLS